MLSYSLIWLELGYNLQHNNDVNWGCTLQYQDVVAAIFLERINRFLARVRLDGTEEFVHVKNTGRCRELLLPGAEVFLAPAAGEKRKTRYDLITVRKNTGVLFNIDSQVPNQVVYEWLRQQDFSKIVPEFRYGNSRIDFYLEKAEARYLLEVKGCTLEVNGIGYFPDAPTERGVKHLRELIRARKDGYEAGVVFVLQMDGVFEVRPNVSTHPEFGQALEEARTAGVQVFCLCCHAEPDALVPLRMVPSLI